MRVALIEMLHPDAAPARGADPAGGGDRGGGGEREDVLRRRRAGVRQRGAGGGLREVRENARSDDGPRAMTSVEHLDEVIAGWSAPPSSCARASCRRTPPRRWSRTARRWRAQAAAELEQLTRAEVSTLAPGQDTLL